MLRSFTVLNIWFMAKDVFRVYDDVVLQAVIWDAAFRGWGLGSGFRILPTPKPHRSFGSPVAS